MAVTTVASTFVVVQKILLVVQGITSFFTGFFAGFKVTGVHLLKYSRWLDEETSQGAFQTIYSLNGERIPVEQVQEYLGDENVICVKRCCCSLTGWFPSGVFTVATWLLAGTAVRHEFILLHTTNFVILIEIGLDGDKKASKTSIIVKSARSNTEKETAEKELLQEKWWVRTMKELKGTNLGQLRFYQITCLVNFWILVSRAAGRNYDAIQKNCKSLARSILYFSKKSPNYWNVLLSLWGVFSDKPFHIFHHLEVIAAEKSFFNGLYAFSEPLRILAENTISWLKFFRTEKLGEEELETFCE